MQATLDKSVRFIDSSEKRGIYLTRVWEESPSVSATGFIPSPQSPPPMHLCYLDESGTPDIPGNTSHYVLAGLSVPIWNWKTCEKEIGIIRRKYDLQNREIHTAWI